MTTTMEELLALAEDVVDKALGKGADVAEATARAGAHLSTKVRLRKIEHLEEAGSKSIGLRLMRGKQVAVSVTSDLSRQGLQRLVDDAFELAALSQPDPFAGPPEPTLLSNMSEHADLSLFDEAMGALDAGEAIRRATAAESAARDYDARIKNSEGASFSRSAGASALVTSGGFRGASRGTYASLSVRPVVEEPDGKKRSGSHWNAKRFLADLDDPRAVGLEAARRTVRKLGARKIPTQEVAVIFDPDAARSIVDLLGSCVNGSAIWRRSSYLVDRLETLVASEHVSIVDDPLIARAPGSRAFDGEGLLSRRNIVVQNGVLKTYLLDSYSGRKLGLPSTANASRGGGGGVGPSSTNFILQPGSISQAELLRATPKALYVTDMMGFGFNAVTGDFSRGAAGFWVENGEFVHPVSEVTISLNLEEILKRIDLVANDLDLRTATASPTFRVSAMTVAGA